MSTGNNVQPYTRYKCVVYDMEDFLKACVQRYIELCPKPPSFRPVDTAFLDEPVIDADYAGSEEAGVLAPVCAKIVMKILYAARVARHDLFKACNALSRYLTKWTPGEDKKLHRLMCYIYHSLSLIHI